MPEDCVFCNLVSKSLTGDILFENDELIVVRDILPKAPVHVLVITKKHIVSVNDLTEADKGLAGAMILAGKDIANQKGIAESGYKLIFNVGKDGGQIIPHLHLHVMGGKQLPE